MGPHIRPLCSNPHNNPHKEGARHGTQEAPHPIIRHHEVAPTAHPSPPCSRHHRRHTEQWISSQSPCRFGPRLPIKRQLTHNSIESPCQHRGQEQHNTSVGEQQSSSVTETMASSAVPYVVSHSTSSMANSPTVPKPTTSSPTSGADNPHSTTGAPSAATATSPGAPNSPPGTPQRTPPPSSTGEATPFHHAKHHANISPVRYRGGIPSPLTLASPPKA
jgi:hypothetical protein